MLSFTFSRNGKFVETGEHFWFPDDVTLGYIIGTRWNLPNVTCTVDHWWSVS